MSDQINTHKMLNLIFLPVSRTH